MRRNRDVRFKMDWGEWYCKTNFALKQILLEKTIFFKKQTVFVLVFYLFYNSNSFRNLCVKWANRKEMQCYFEREMIKHYKPYLWLIFGEVLERGFSLIIHKWISVNLKYF